MLFPSLINIIVSVLFLYPPAVRTRRLGGHVTRRQPVDECYRHLGVRSVFRERRKLEGMIEDGGEDLLQRMDWDVADYYDIGCGNKF